MLKIIFDIGADQIYRRFADISDGEYGRIHNELIQGLLDYIQEVNPNYLVEKRILDDAVLQLQLFAERERLDPNSNPSALKAMERFANFLENRRRDLIDIVDEISY